MAVGAYELRNVIFCETMSKENCIIRNFIFDEIRNFSRIKLYFVKREISLFIKYEWRNTVHPSEKRGL